MTHCQRSRGFQTAVYCALLWCGMAQFGVAAIKTDYLMDSDPAIQMPDPAKNFRPAFKQLWLAALKRPDADMQRMAAETIARAHQFGIPALAEAIPDLERILASPTSHPVARFSAARALITLDSRGSAEQLLSASQAYGADLRQLIEPALAAWNYKPAKAIWSQRLDSPKTETRDLILAMRGLAQIADASSLPHILDILRDDLRGPDVRVEAATAAGRLSEDGFDSDADRLGHDARSPQYVNQICAIRLLSRHTSQAAVQLLTELAGHREPAVAASALHRLNDIDSQLVLPLAEAAMQNADQRVRDEGVTAYLRLPTPERISRLGQLLNDPHPGIRRRISADLLKLTEQQELNEPIKTTAQEILSGDRWQGQEQAALLLGQLEYKPSSPRFVELLESPRGEVRVAAAWALRKVAVEETIPVIISQIRRRTGQLVAEGTTLTALLDEQVAHHLETLGVFKAQEAVPLMQEYIPKRKVMGELSRSAAIWALGKIFAGTRNNELENLLDERMRDEDMRPVESQLVKKMSIIGLGRMKCVEEMPYFRQMGSPPTRPSRLSMAARWAFKELTNEELPPLTPNIASQGNWFLEPFP